MLKLTVLALAVALLAGCDGFSPATSSSEAFLKTPVNGDTLHVAAGFVPAPDEPRLLWNASLARGVGAHRMEVEVSPSPTFDPSVPHSLSSTRYEAKQRIYAEHLPRPRTLTGELTGGPVRYFWRVRVAGGEGDDGPWSEPGTFVVVADRPAVED